MKDEIKVGDLITAYHKGYHRVTAVTRRFGPQYASNRSAGDEQSPLITYDQVLDSNGKQKKRAGLDCDAAFCRKVTMWNLVDETRETITTAIKKQNAVLAILGEAQQAKGAELINIFIKTEL
jgi:hypothetical protein